MKIQTPVSEPNVQGLSEQFFEFRLNPVRSEEDTRCSQALVDALKLALEKRSRETTRPPVEWWPWTLSDFNLVGLPEELHTQAIQTLEFEADFLYRPQPDQTPFYGWRSTHVRERIAHWISKKIEDSQLFSWYRGIFFWIFGKEGVDENVRYLARRDRDIAQSHKNQRILSWLKGVGPGMEEDVLVVPDRPLEDETMEREQ